jgi:hypothetical protein
MSLALNTDEVQRVDGVEWRFAGWTNVQPADARATSLIAPASPVTYQALFVNNSPTANNPTPAPTTAPASPISRRVFLSIIANP